MNHHTILAKSTNWHNVAYVFPDGIAYAFTTRVKVGAASHEIESLGFVRKTLPIRLHKFREKDGTEHPDDVFPYIVENIPAKLLEGMTEFNHYRECYSEDAPTVLKGIQIEGIYVSLPGKLKVTANIIHGMVNHEWPLGSDIKPLHWKGCQTLESFIHKNKEAFSTGKPVAFDVDERKPQ